MGERYLAIEEPDTTAVVDFLGPDACSIQAIRLDGKLSIRVTVPHPADDSMFKWEDFVVPLRLEEDDG